MDNDEDVSAFLEEARHALQCYVQESWLHFAPCVATGMTIQPMGAGNSSTGAGLSQSELPAELQPAISHVVAPTFDKLSCHFDELCQELDGS